MKFRRPLSIMSRTSSITNCFVQAIIPSIEPTVEEITEALSILGMTVDKMTCAYCGSGTTDWDHLRPLVKNKRPTGYITEIRNLVPACGPCNQSKGASDWNSWMKGTARGSPRTRAILDLDDRQERLRRFEAWGNVKALPLSELADEGSWSKHWSNLDIVLGAMKTAQTHAEHLRGAIRENLAKRVRTSR